MELVPPPGVLITLMLLDSVAIDYVIVPHQGRFRSRISQDRCSRLFDLGCRGATRIGLGKCTYGVTSDYKRYLCLGRIC